MPDNDQKLKVYLETSFVNYLTGRQTSNVKIASEQAYTRQWWEIEKNRCDVFVSGYTINESEDGGPEYVKRRRDGYFVDLELQAFGQSSHIAEDAINSHG